MIKAQREVAFVWYYDDDDGSLADSVKPQESEREREREQIESFPNDVSRVTENFFPTEPWGTFVDVDFILNQHNT